MNLGRPKPLEQITLADVLDHPIWIWAWEAGVEGDAEMDETWQLPVLDTDDVTSDMVEPIVTFRVAGSDIVGSGSYREGRLFGMALWRDDKWKVLKDCSLSPPLTLVAVPRIEGMADVEFLCADLIGDEAVRVS